jgi:steroid 5-alpha reductase family enzyme
MLNPVILEALAMNGLILFGVALLLWVVAVQIDDASFVDSYWGGGMALLAAISWLRLETPGPLATLIAAMAVLWGLRLAIHIFLRWRHEGEDKRYKLILKKDREAGRFAIAALTKVFLFQSVLLFLVSSPAQYGIMEAGGVQPISGLALVGAALWLLGMVFEVVGDRQLAKFKANPDNAGKVLDTGLWRYTRHPNYFGDVCAWWGIWIAAASAGWWVAAATIIGPIFLTFTLTKWSGAPLLEGGMQRSKGDAYTDYKRRTSSFIPWPPKTRD